MSNAAIILIGVILYAIFGLGFIGYLAYRKSRSGEEDFMLAGRQIGPIFLLLSLILTQSSGLTFYGFPGSAFRTGLGFFGATLAVGLVGSLMFFAGHRIWLIGRKKGYVTPAEYFRDRYQSKFYHLLVSWLFILFSIPYLTLQLSALAQGVETSTEGLLPYVPSLIIFFFFMTFYIIIGGMRSIIWHDVFHAILGIGAIGLAIFFVVNSFSGGVVEAVQSINQSHAEHLGNPGPAGQWTSQGWLGMFFAATVTCIAWPQVFQRMYLFKDRKSIRQMAILYPLTIMLVFGGLMFLTMVGLPHYLGELSIEQSDQFIPLLLLEHTPLMVQLMMLLGLLAFSLSTADSQAFLMSTSFSRDVYKPYINQKATERQSVSVARIMIVISIALAVVGAILRPAFLVQYAYDFAMPGWAQTMPAIIGGLWWRRANKHGAIAGTLTGIVVLIVTLFNLVPLPLLGGWHPIILSLAANTIVYVSVSYLTAAPPKEIIEEFHDDIDKRALDPSVEVINNKKIA